MEVVTSMAPVLNIAADRPATLAQGFQLGPYLVLGLIAKGGMGQVYLAHDTRRDRSVALKVLTPGVPADGDRQARFAREARTTALLNHPNIVALFDVGSHDGAPFVVSELLEGETLRTRLKRGPLSATVASAYAMEVARGLIAAHQLGVVHRNLKPENLFITDDDRVKILDFGTRPDVLMGPVDYVSPEQARGLPSDHRSDIFSLGVILYEMVTGAAPFHGDSAGETLDAILEKEMPPIRSFDADVPPELERVIRHCLEKNPEMRFQSARDLIFSLEWSSYFTMRSRQPAASSPSGSWKRGLAALLRLI